MFFGCSPCCGGFCQQHDQIWPSLPQISVEYDYRYTSSSYSVYGGPNTSPQNQYFINTVPSWDTGLVSGTSYSSPSSINDNDGWVFATDIGGQIAQITGELIIYSNFGRTNNNLHTLLPALNLRISEYACKRINPDPTAVGTAAQIIPDPKSNSIQISISTTGASPTYNSVETSLNSGSTSITNILQSQGGSSGLIRYGFSEPRPTTAQSLSWRFYTSLVYSPAPGSLGVTSYSITRTGHRIAYTRDTINVTLEVVIKNITVRSTGESVNLTGFPENSYSAINTR